LGKAGVKTGGGGKSNRFKQLMVRGVQSGEGPEEGVSMD